MATDLPRRPLLRTRILAGVLSIILVAFAAVGIVAATELNRYLVARTDTTLRTILNLARPRLDRLVPRAEAGQRFPQLQHNLGDYYLAFFSDRGSTVILRPNPELAPQVPADPAALVASPRTVPSIDGHDQLRELAERVDGGVLVVATSLEPVTLTVGRLRLVIVAASIIALALAAVGVTVVVRRGLRPLESMAAAADRINAGDLTERVTPSDRSTEVGRLGSAFNGMLARIGCAVREREADQRLMRQFFADASHELRNPLATVRANAELYRQGALREAHRLDRAMRHIELEAQRMSRLVDDMLRLARLDQFPEPAREPVDLTALLTGCLRRASDATPDRHWDVRVAPNLVTLGDEELLERAIDNLIANVHAHTPADTVATLTAARHHGSLVIDVSDNGPGVPPEHLSRLFDRFHRATTRADHTGSGLGLAIVAKTAAVLGGGASASANEPHGLRVTVTLPATPRPAPSP
ncbi:MAG: HAMP domain-containing histidine kinase [Pseudonocardia sp.]|nr:HAMP domain-containing histidine kinase [Pseudonocardia sp.]